MSNTAASRTVAVALIRRRWLLYGIVAAVIVILAVLAFQALGSTPVAELAPTRQQTEAETVATAPVVPRPVPAEVDPHDSPEISRVPQTSTRPAIDPHESPEAGRVPAHE